MLNALAMVCGKGGRKGNENQIGSISTIGVGLGALLELDYAGALIGSQLLKWSSVLLVCAAMFIFVLVSLGCFAAITQHSALLLLVHLQYTSRVNAFFSMQPVPFSLHYSQPSLRC
jgi:hypothetical protein